MVGRDELTITLKRIYNRQLKYAGDIDVGGNGRDMDCS